MRAILLNLPDAKFDEPIGKLTIREAFTWYIEPAMERAKELRESMRDAEHGTVSGAAITAERRMTDDEAWLLLSTMNCKGMPERKTDG